MTKISTAVPGKVAFAEVPAFTAQWLNTPEYDLSWDTSMVGDNELRNDYFTVTIDSKTGGIRSVKANVSRAENLFSQRLASFRQAGDSPNVGMGLYGEMVADNISLSQFDNLTARATSSGRLVQEDTELAEFRQQVTIYRASNQIDFEFELQLLCELEHLPWRNYLACRFAWKNEGATRLRRVQGVWTATYHERITAPEGLKIDDADLKMTMWCNELPYHRMSSLHTLDTLLAVRGTVATKSKMSIQLEHTRIPSRPLIQSIPNVICRAIAHEGKHSTRLFQLHPASLEIVSMSSLVDDRGVVNGVAITLQESGVRSGSFRILGPRDWRQVHKVDLQDNFLHDVETRDGVAVGSYYQNQLFRLRLFW
ncbi:MAG: hypothetical protein R3C03_02310 [Pirellulaceae bacterium]